MDRIRTKSLAGMVSRPTPTIKVWPTKGNEHIAHPVSGALRAGVGGTSWAYDSFTVRRIAAGEITPAPPTADIGRQREAIIEQKLAEDSQDK